MKVTQRLLALVGLAVIGIFSVAVLATVQIGSVFKAANYGNENSVPSLLALYDIGEVIAQERVNTYRHLLPSDAAGLTTLDNELFQQRAAEEKNFKDYAPLISDDKEQSLFDQVKLVYTQYAQAQDEMLARLKEGNLKQAQDLTVSKIAPLGTDLRKALVAQIAYNASLAKEGSKAAINEKGRSMMLIIGITVAVSIVAVFIGLNIARGITKPLAEVVDVAGHVANGNLAIRVEVGRGRDEIAQLKSAIHKMVEQLRTTIGEVVQGSQRISSLAGELSTTAEQVASSTESQSTSTSSAAAAVEELTVSIDHVGVNSNDVSQRASEADKMAEAGNHELNEASRRVSEVADKVDGSAAQIQALSEQIQQIGSITTVIREVADQTNLLALNAAIEAARAGEQGRGFAVVADEVRKLAERTTTSVQEITGMIGAIQDGAESVVASMRESRDMVANIVEVAAAASKSMQDIRTATGVVQQSIGEVSSAMQEQRLASLDLANNVQSIAQMSEENAAAVESVAQSATTLMGVANGLQESVQRFRL